MEGGPCRIPELIELRIDEHEDFASDLEGIAREEARRMLAQALEAEVAVSPGRSP